MSNSKDLIIQNINRYLNLRRFSNDSVFNRQLEDVQNWQRQRMANTYLSQLKDEKEKGVLDFFLDEIYRGIDLSHVANKLEKTIKVADKLFSDLGLIDIVFEFNAVSAELDEAITEQVFEQMQADDINDDIYRQASVALGNKDKRFLQLKLIRQFAHGLDDIVSDKGVYRAFKLGKYPAKIGGLGSLYQLMEKGFETMLSVDHAEGLIKAVVDREQVYFDALYAGETLR